MGVTLACLDHPLSATSVTPVTSVTSATLDPGLAVLLVQVRVYDEDLDVCDW